jgi:hypothetical protein
MSLISRSEIDKSSQMHSPVSTFEMPGISLRIALTLGWKAADPCSLFRSGVDGLKAQPDSASMGLPSRCASPEMTSDASLVFASPGLK